MSKRELVKTARRGKIRVYVGRGYKRPRLVRALVAGFEATGPHPTACDAYRVKIQPSCEEPLEAVAEWVGLWVDVLAIDAKKSELIVCRRRENGKK